MGKKKSKYTPLERQVVDIKRRYMDAVIAVEVGYKFVFFGADAQVASRVLNIAHFPKGAFMAQASIPTHRLYVALHLSSFHL